MTNVSIDSSSPASSSGIRSAIDLFFGIEVQQDADVAELERAVDEDGLLAELGGGRDGEVDGDRRPTDAALRAEHGDQLTGFPVSRPAAALAAAAAATFVTVIRPCFSRSRV